MSLRSANMGEKLVVNVTILFEGGIYVLCFFFAVNDVCQHALAPL